MTDLQVLIDNFDVKEWNDKGWKKIITHKFCECIHKIVLIGDTHRQEKLLGKMLSYLDKWNSCLLFPSYVSDRQQKQAQIKYLVEICRGVQQSLNETPPPTYTAREKKFYDIFVIIRNPEDQSILIIKNTVAELRNILMNHIVVGKSTTEGCKKNIKSSSEILEEKKRMLINRFEELYKKELEEIT